MNPTNSDLNLLQEYGVISDNCVTWDDVHNKDEALKWLADTKGMGPFSMMNYQTERFLQRLESPSAMIRRLDEKTEKFTGEDGKQYRRFIPKQPSPYKLP
jgi:hypothetical protein